MAEWTTAQRRQKRAEYARLYASGYGRTGRGTVVPDDVTVLTRDPYPCGYCGVRGACRHRPWEAVA